MTLLKTSQEGTPWIGQTCPMPAPEANREDQGDCQPDEYYMELYEDKQFPKEDGGERRYKYKGGKTEWKKQQMFTAGS